MQGGGGDVVVEPRALVPCVDDLQRVRGGCDALIHPPVGQVPRWEQVLGSVPGPGDRM